MMKQQIPTAGKRRRKSLDPSGRSGPEAHGMAPAYEEDWMPLALALALFIGASLAVFGAGGSIVTMPVLVYGLGLDAHQAAGTSLLVVGAVALAGAALQWRCVHARTALLFGAAGMVGAVPGAWANHQVPSAVVLTGLGLLMLVAAVRLGMTAGSVDRRDPAREVHAWRAMALGSVVGLATGFFGVGGGFLIVPALTLFLGMALRPAVATSLLVIALNSAAGLGGHLVYGGVAWRVGAMVTVAALLGAVVALPIANRLAGARLQRGFAGALATLGTVMLLGTLREWLG
jgi:hypothetical protein